MRLIVVLLLTISIVPSSLADDALKQALDQELAAMKCPGALVGILVGNEEPAVFALGVADVDTKAPMQRDFHMRVASVSKMFVGTAILLLADEGKLSLDDPISKYVDGVPEGDKITLRQLGNNTSGLFNTIENKDFQAIIVKEPRRPWTAEEILHYAFTQPSYHAPSEKKFRYSNTNSVLLGEVIEKVTGQPYADFIHERIIRPLGLKETGFIADADVPPPASSSYRNGYPDKWLGYGDVFYNVTGYSSSWTGAAGNMYSTVDDLLSVGKALTTGKLLSEKSQQVLTDWIPTGHENIRYGFCLGERNGWVGHTGDVPGYSNFLAYFPGKDTTVVVLSNLSNNADGSSPAERLRDVVIKELHLTENNP